MASAFPGSLDSFATNHADNTGEVIHAVDVNNLADAVNKIEAELGVNPSTASYTTVAAAITALIAATAAAGIPATIADGAPTTLQQGFLYFETAASGTKVVGLWVGTSNVNAPRKVLDATPDLFVTTTGTTPDPATVSDPSLLIDTSTTPWTIKAMTGGAWQLAGGTGASTTPRVNAKWVLPGDAVVDATPNVVGSSPAMADRFVVPFAGTVSRHWVQALTSPSGGSLAVDLERSTNAGSSWTSLYPTNPANRPAILPATKVSGIAVPDTTTVAVGDWIRPRVASVGTSTQSAPTFVVHDGPSFTLTAPSITRPPEATNANDVLIVTFYYNPGTVTVSSTGAAFTLRNSGGTQTSSSGARIWVFTRVLGSVGSDPGPWDFTVTGTPTQGGVIRDTIRGADPASIIDGEAYGLKASPNTSNVPALTTTTAPTLEWFHLRLPQGAASTTISNGAANGYTIVNGFTTSVAGNHVAWKARTGTVTSDVWTPTLSPTNSAAIARLAFKAASAPAAAPGADVTVYAEITGT